MDNLKELKSLKEVTKLSEIDMMKIILRYYDELPQFNGKTFITEEFYNMVIEEYEHHKKFIVNLDEISEIKSENIPFKNGKFIYFLFDDNVLVYIGQTANIANRIASHLKNKIFNKVTCIESNNHIFMETVNIKFYQPKYNVQIISDEEIFSVAVKKII